MEAEVEVEDEPLVDYLTTTCQEQRLSHNRHYRAQIVELVIVVMMVRPLQ